MRAAVILLLLLVLGTWAFNAKDTPILKLESNIKLDDLVGNPPGDDDELEASGVIYRHDKQQAFVVCDNLPRQVIQLDHPQAPSPDDRFVDLRWPLVRSGYEGITYDPQTNQYFTVYEAMGEERTHFARILQFDEDFFLHSSSFVEFVFEANNKGIEGLSVVYRNGTQYLLALCEGNGCQGGDEGKEHGKGTILVIRFDQDVVLPGGNKGIWVVEDSIALPSELPFEDYSGLDVQNGHMAVVSQSSQLMWTGKLSADSWSVEGGDNGGNLYAFPVSSDGEEFCGVEGVSWIDAETVLVVSDKSDEPDCGFYAQSATTFKIPAM